MKYYTPIWASEICNSIPPDSMVDIVVGSTVVKDSKIEMRVSQRDLTDFFEQDKTGYSHSYYVKGIKYQLVTKNAKIQRLKVFLKQNVSPNSWGLFRNRVREILNTVEGHMKDEGDATITEFNAIDVAMCRICDDPLIKSLGGYE